MSSAVVQAIDAMVLQQDAYDVLTGQWVARRGAIPPLSDQRNPVTRVVSTESKYHCPGC
jgi:hypothetical protein